MLSEVGERRRPLVVGFQRNQQFEIYNQKFETPTKLMLPPSTNRHTLSINIKALSEESDMAWILMKA